MRRVLLLIAAGALAFIGFVQVAPPAETPPDFGATDTTEPDSATGRPSAWYCPWVEAGDVVDTTVVVGSQVATSVNMTVLNPISNGDPAVFGFDISGPSGTGVDVGSIARRGESPTIVELSNGPAAVSSIDHSDAFISGDRCAVSIPKTWYLTGGSTKTGSFTELRIFNPFADNAEVTVTAYSEFDLDLITELDGFDVPGREWTTIDMEPFVPLRDQLVFTVESTTGLVIPVLVRSDERGQAMIPGSGASETWDFPIVTAGELEPFISVMSAGDDDITVTIDIVGETGITRDARTVTVDSATPALIPISDIAAPPYGVRVRASSLVAASVIAVVPEADPDEIPGEPDAGTTTTTIADETTTTVAPTEDTFIRGLAGTIGAAAPSSQWIVPFETQLDAQTTVWIMNATDEVATVTLQPLAEEPDASTTVTIEPGTTAPVPVTSGVGIYGYFVDSSTPVSVAWVIVGDRGVALSAAISAN